MAARIRTLHEQRRRSVAWTDDTVDQHSGSTMWYLCFNKREFSKKPKHACMAREDGLVKNVADMLCVPSRLGNGQEVFTSSTALSSSSATAAGVMKHMRTQHIYKNSHLVWPYMNQKLIKMHTAKQPPVRSFISVLQQGANTLPVDKICHKLVWQEL